MNIVRYAVCWTDTAGARREELVEGPGSYLSALHFRDRLPDDSGAHVVKQSLCGGRWRDVGVIDDMTPRRGKRGE